MKRLLPKLKHSEKKYISIINKFSLPIIEKLTEAGLKFDISGRPKSIFSASGKRCRQKMSLLKRSMMYLL